MILHNGSSEDLCSFVQHLNSIFLQNDWLSTHPLKTSSGISAILSYLGLCINAKFYGLSLERTSSAIGARFYDFYFRVLWASSPHTFEQGISSAQYWFLCFIQIKGFSILLLAWPLKPASKWSLNEKVPRSTNLAST